MNDLDLAEKEGRLEDAVIAYLESVEAGGPVERSSFPELAEFFADTDAVRRWLAPLREMARLVKSAAREPGGTIASGATIAYEIAPPKLMVSFGDYEVIKELGRGGMGVVYKARHVKFDRLVALKRILAGHHAGAEQTARFLAEARAVARLQHPNIVQIHEIGEHGGLPYFSLEYVDGGSLAARLKGAPPSDMEAAQLVELLAATVHYAHGRGVVHRDLKPANILLAGDGTPKIADFGLAKILTEDSGATRTGAILGTPSYMAPEQAAGRAREIGPAIDIYALGAILYELLTGRPPFCGESIQETLRSVEDQTPDAPHVHNPRVDRALEAICLKCLEKAPKDRYATAEALAEDLAAFVRGESVQAHSGTATRWLGAVLRETRYTEVMTLWSGIWMGLGVMYFLICVAKSLLFWTGLASHGAFSVIWLVMLLTTGGLIWFCRLRRGPSLFQIERRMIQIWSFFWIGFVFTAYQFQRIGAPVEGLLPILIIELGVCTGCMAAMLGGSFYVMALACLVTAALEAFSPQLGALISGVFCSPALFWVGWKYSRPRSAR